MAEFSIASSANPLFKAVKRAIQRGQPTPGGLVVAESPHLLREARKSGAEIETVLLSEDAPTDLKRKAGRAGRTLSVELFKELSSTETSQGVISLVRLPEWSQDQVFQANGLVVILDGLQDPGNVGTIVRTAEAFGAAGVVFSSGSARPYHPKTLRASAGSLFRLPFISLSPGQAIEASKRSGRKLVAASARSGRAISEFNWNKTSVVIGSEAHGVREEYRSAGESVNIPIAGAESLNAAVAAAVILYAACRA